jgi:hypothetical protein
MVCQAGQGRVCLCFPAYPVELGQGDLSSLVLPSELVLELLFLPTDLFELVLVLISLLVFPVALAQGKVSFLVFPVELALGMTSPQVVLVAWDLVVVWSLAYSFELDQVQIFLKAVLAVQVLVPLL